jgi:hypothetical protein
VGLVRRSLVAASLALVVLAGCDSYNDKRGRGDAPVSRYDDKAAVVVNMPDLFMNVAFKCLGVNGVYAHTREAAPVIIPNDPICAEGADPLGG